MLWGPHYQNWDMNLEKNTTFAEQKIKVQVSGREKTIYSIYRKMREIGITRTVNMS